MKKALVTLAIGEKYIGYLKNFCYDLWKEYADINNLDIIVFDEVFDESSRALGRSPAWQKLLILSQPSIQKYDQVAWIDTDILINPKSPDIFQDIPIEKIGAVDAYATPSKEEHKIAIERIYQYWTLNDIKFIPNDTPTKFHNNFGIEGNFSSAVQTGVMVLSPNYHRDLFEHVYNNYEDKGPAYWNYEMRPLSYEILKNGMIKWLNPKFNIPWGYLKQTFYPFLRSDNIIEKIFKNIVFLKNSSLLSKCITTSYINNYFLHFAGCISEMAYLNKKVSSIFDI